MGPNLTMGLEEELVRLEPSSKAMLHDPGVIKRVKTRIVPELRQNIYSRLLGCVPSRRRCCTVNLRAIERVAHGSSRT